MTCDQDKRRRGINRVLAGTCAGAMILTGAAPAFAAQQMRLIRDAEIEALITDYARPILGAAGLSRSNVEIFIINSSQFNAFAPDGRRIFITTGALAQSKTPGETIGVLAHETGHLAGGHHARLRSALAQAQTLSIISMILAAGATVAAASSGNNNAGQVGIATATGSQSAINRSLLAYRRTEERAADRAALAYLNKTGQSAKGMLSVFKRFADRMLFAKRGSDPYLFTHPLPDERMTSLTRGARKSRFFNKKAPAGLRARHQMMRAKLAGFTTPRRVARVYRNATASMAARYAHAIAAYRLRRTKKALTDIDALIRLQPKNPYFHELKGQILLETGKPGAALAPLQRAVALAPKAPLIRVMLGHALVETGGRGNLRKAVSHLKRATQRDKNATIGFRHLATAYARLGDRARADLATAQGYFHDGRYGDARRHAKRARSNLKRGSPEWLAANDIATHKPQKR